MHDLNKILDNIRSRDSQRAEEYKRSMRYFGGVGLEDTLRMANHRSLDGLAACCMILEYLLEKEKNENQTSTRGNGSEQSTGK